MRVKSIPILLLAAGALWAQTAPAPAKSPAVKTAAKTQAAKVPATPTAKPPALAKTAAPKAAATPALKAPPTVAKTPAASTGKAKPAPVKKAPVARPKQAKSKVEAKPMEPRGQSPAKRAAAPLHPAVRRDPFISPVVNRPSAVPCSTGGNKCLAIGDIVLKGVAKTESGMLAMVENGARKAYILRENDPVFNGYVVKITMDSVLLRENVVDRVGHQSTRDVVKKIPITPLG